MTENVFENNLEKYINPELYDHMYEKYQKDLDLILEYTHLVEQEIIELACGTGRLTIPMARRGYSMIGVDIHEGMLQRAKTKAEDEKLNIKFFQQDCSKLDVPSKASLIFMTGNSFQHFLTNDVQNQLFESIKRHLVPGGYFIFDTRNPLLSELAIVDEYETRYKDKNNYEVIEQHREIYEATTQIQHCYTNRQIFDGNVLVKTEQDRILLRYTYPLELERLLQQHSFELVECYGDWNKNNYAANSVQMVIICRLVEK
ncbi:class I SAM-dependent methyltransferase [Bacillus sp. CGMCC 1.16607]|uniref:class I SAM-dependent methyltransferase n=1 Tax=Bacillus sp. CGMCC 1.16607 TaxID=3351842 RepID=UPI0036305517